MTSQQMELGEERGVAEELAAGQRSISIAEFFERNKHMLGFDSDARAIVTAVKEGVDNSLTHDTPFVYRTDGETIHAPIGDAIDDLIESNPEDVIEKRDGDLEKLRVDGMEALSFDEGYDVGFQRVSSVFRHRVNSDIYRITVEGGREVELTDYHSVFVLRDGEVVSVETSDIDEDDYVVLPDTEWGGGTRSRVDLVDELLKLPPERTEDIGLYGVEHLIGAHYDEIREFARVQYRMSDFRKCDRLPFNVLRELDLDREAYRDCEIGYRYGRNNVPAVLPVDESLAELLGLYVAEGCVTGEKGDHEKVYLSLGSHETELIAHAERLVSEVFGLDPSTVDAHETATNVTIPAKIVGLLFEEVFDAGTSAREKRLPRWVLDFPAPLRERFALGFAAGDGYPTASVIEVLLNGGDLGDVEEYRVTLSTSSDRLSSGLRYLLSSIGYDTTHERTEAETRPIEGREAEFGTSNLLYVHTDQSRVSAKRLPASETVSSVQDPKLAYNLDGRQERVETEHALALADGGGIEFAGDGRAIAESDLAALPVTDVERIDYDGKWVYDVSVPGDENFMAGTAPLACHNSLDATEEAGIPPDIYVEIEDVGDYYRLVIEDNGPGIPAENVPDVYGKMLYGSRFHIRSQSRGQQGIGISAAVLYAQLTSGKPAKITSKPKGGTATYFELTIDTDDNEPEVDAQRETTWEPPHGTKVVLELEANMRARRQLHAYVRQTAVVNPHARIEFKEPEAHMKYERATDQLPAETEEIRPHPHGVELGTLIKMLEATESYSISGFLQGEFTRVGKKTADKLVRAFKDRHYGRELSWTPPAVHEDVDVRGTIADAVANKGAAATERFVDYVLEGGDGVAGLTDRERVSRSELDALVDAAADATEADTDRTFGDTVRENATAAAWRAVVSGDGDGDSPTGAVDRLAPDLYALVDGATTSRKDDAAVEAMARRIATRIVESGPRHRQRRAELKEHVAWAAERTAEREDESFGETAREKIVDALWAVARTVPDDPPKVRAVAGDRDVASRLLEAMRETSILAPPTDCLAPITEELVEEGLRKEYDADFFAAATRDAEVHGGDPFIAEAGIAYGGDLPDDGEVDLLRFANRVPLVYQRGACATADVVTSINWRNYGLDQPGGTGMPGGPAVIMVHVASTNVPFTSESKDAVANVPEIEDEIELALREAARELKSYLSKQRSLEKRRRKENVIAEILPRMATKLEEVTGREPLDVEDSLARIMNNVLVEREREDGDVRLVVTNHSDRTADLEVTDIVTAEPGDPEGDGAEPTVVEMDGEWFVKWAPTVASGDRAVLRYSASDASFDVSVDGVEAEKLTVDA